MKPIIKYLYLYFSFIILNSPIIYTQSLTDLNNQYSDNKESVFALPGSHLLYDKENEIRNFIKTHPEYKSLSKSSPAQWNFSIGDSYEWWATNLVTYNEYQVPSTCRAIGDHCYIFVEDAVWNVSVNQDAVDSITEAFENSTPADANKGIYQTNVESFGEPPDVDSDPRIIILILDIKDGFSGSGGYVIGYFYSANEYADGDPALGGIRSNHTEIYYLDANPTDLTTETGVNDAMATAAHEFQHMIHWKWDGEEYTFVDEGCAMIAEHICGYNLEGWFNMYQEDTNIFLFRWDNEDAFPDYARAALWTLYLYEQYPDNFLKELVANPLIGIDGINSTLSNHVPNLPIPPGRLFDSVFSDWLIANYANDPTLDRKYYYDYTPLSKPIPIHTHEGRSDIPLTSETVNPLSANYITFTGGSNLSVEFSSNDNHLDVKAIKIGSTVIEDVPINTSYKMDGYGSTFSEVTFVVYNNSESQTATYSYSAYGPEISYDDGIPEGYINNLSEGDSLAVQFDGKPNTKLDSVRIAFRYSGNIKMDIHEYGGVTNFRGKKFGNTIEITSPKETSSEPFPNPYDNWVNVPINGNISTSEDFVISFLVGSSQNDPAIMYSSEQELSKGGSKSYYHSGDYKSGGWEFLMDEAVRGNVKDLLVRAYTSSGSNLSVDQNDDASNNEPQIFLEQNFPNPFNAFTTIQYEIDNDSDVILSIYDLAGNKVKTIVDDKQLSGNYSIQWDGTNEIGYLISSGIYIYILKVNNIELSNKLVYLK